VFDRHPIIYHMQRKQLLLLLWVLVPAAQAQLLDPGFESGMGWNFSCTNGGGGFSTDVPTYGGSTSLSLPMLSSTQPDCYFVDGIMPTAYQVLTGVQNGNTIQVACMVKCVPDIPGNVNFLNANIGFGWLTSGGVALQDFGGGAGLNVTDTWTSMGASYTFSAMPVDALPLIFLHGYAFANANGTVLFDNVSVQMLGTGALLSAKAWLDGCYVDSQGLMRDDLRVAGLVPLNTPYSSPAATIAPAVLAVSGPNAIVDWVQVELRAIVTGISTLRAPALLQRDGDIVALDGVSPLSIPVASGLYYVHLRHRNHLGVITANLVSVNASNTLVDFRSPATACLVRPAPNTDLPRKTVGATRALWAGELTNDYKIKYTGAGNDRDNILAACCGPVPTLTLNGYYSTDVNLDGVVKYVGANNDRDPILVNIGGTTPTAVRIEQVPQP